MKVEVVPDGGHFLRLGPWGSPWRDRPQYAPPEETRAALRPTAAALASIAVTNCRNPDGLGVSSPIRLI